MTDDTNEKTIAALEARITTLETEIKGLDEILEHIPADLSALILAFVTACDLLEDIDPENLAELKLRLRTASQTRHDLGTETALANLINRISN